MSNFLAELKRRNVYKVAVAYAVASWLLIQIATQVFPFFEIPNWAVRLVVLILIAGFPVALVFSWAMTDAHLWADTIALVYLGLGDRNEALNWLEEGCKERDGFNIGTIRVD